MPAGTRKRPILSTAALWVRTDGTVRSQVTSSLVQRDTDVSIFGLAHGQLCAQPGKPKSRPTMIRGFAPQHGRHTRRPRQTSGLQRTTCNLPGTEEGCFRGMRARLNPVGPSPLQNPPFSETNLRKATFQNPFISGSTSRRFHCPGRRFSPLIASINRSGSSPKPKPKGQARVTPLLQPR